MDPASGSAEDPRHVPEDQKTASALAAAPPSRARPGKKPSDPGNLPTWGTGTHAAVVSAHFVEQRSEMNALLDAGGLFFDGIERDNILMPFLPSGSPTGEK